MNHQLQKQIEAARYIETKAEATGAKADAVYKQWKLLIVNAAMLEAEWEKLNAEEIKLRQEAYAAKRRPAMTAEEHNRFPSGRWT